MSPGSVELRPQAGSGALDSGQAVTPKDTASTVARGALGDLQAFVARYHTELLVESLQRVEFALWLESRAGVFR